MPATTITIKKTDKNSQPLPGAVFRLSMNKNGSWVTIKDNITVAVHVNRLREKVEKSLEQCTAHFVNAGAVMNKKSLDSSLMSSQQQTGVDVSSKNIMSVDVPVFSAVSKSPDQGDIFPYGLAFTSFELDDAVMALSDLMPDLIRLAEIEKSCELMASEIERTRRRVNSLEHVMIPRYEATIKYIAMKLEENDRSSRTRLMKVKDMLLEKAHHYSEKY